MLIPQGINQVNKIVEKPKEPTKFKISKNITLQQVAENHKLYTPGLLYSRVLLEVDPIVDFLDKQSTDVQFTKIEFDHAIFEGIGKSWDNVLIAVSHDIWPKLSGFLGSICIVDHRFKLVVRTAYRAIRIPDWLSKEPQTASVDVIVLCLDTNKGCAYITETDKLPKVVETTYLLPETQLFADSILAGKNPYLDMPVILPELPLLRLPEEQSLDSLTTRHQSEILKAIKTYGG